MTVLERKNAVSSDYIEQFKKPAIAGRRACRVLWPSPQTASASARVEAKLSRRHHYSRATTAPTHRTLGRCSRTRRGMRWHSSAAHGRMICSDQPTVICRCDRPRHTAHTYTEQTQQYLPITAVITIRCRPSADILCGHPLDLCRHANI